jgi:hypothetical protein
MLKLSFKIIAGIGSIVLGVVLFVKVLPWALGILAALGVVFELFHLWIRSRNDDPPCRA